MDRQSLHDDEGHSNNIDDIDVFDDEFAVEDFTVADGFRPRGSISSSIRRSTSPESTPISSTPIVPQSTISQSTTPTSPFRPTRSSIRKSRRLENPFHSAEEAEAARSSNNAHVAGGFPYSPAGGRPSMSSVSSRAFAPTTSPFVDHNGPSHPYNMYEQGTNLGRTVSIISSSTIRPSAGASTPMQGPSHPYNMYPQNVADDTEDDVDEPPQARFHVGFLGLDTTRNVEPDASLSFEPHSEQLPAYSEYPEDGAPRNTGLTQPSPVSPHSPTNTSTLGPTPRHALLPLSTRVMHRAPQSMSDQRNDVPERDEHEGNALIRTSTSASSMLRSSLPTSSLSEPKSWKEKSWSEKRKTRFCGVPFSWILIFSACILFLIATVAGVIGGFMHGRSEAEAAAASASLTPYKDQTPTSTASNSLLDASPISTATATAIPLGSYSLQPGFPQGVQNSCLTDQSQSNAWNCDLADGTALAISVGNPPNGGPLGAYLYSAIDSNTINWGTQTPQTMFSPLVLVTDINDPSRGPAWQFQAFYDKVVVAPPDTFSGSSTSKRSPFHHRMGDGAVRHQVAAGQQPWFCFWNSTLIEGFIYIQDNATRWNFTGPPPSSSGSATITSATSGSSATFASTVDPNSQPTGYGTQYRRAPAPEPSHHGYKNYDREYDPWSALQLYPLVVMIEERRLPGSPAPYCQKYQILDDGYAGLLTDSNGQPQQITLSEEDPGAGAYATAGLSKRTLVDGSCHCQWFSGASS